MTTNYTGVIVIRKHLENSVVLSFSEEVRKVRKKKFFEEFSSKTGNRRSTSGGTLSLQCQLFDFPSKKTAAGGWMKSWLISPHLGVSGRNALTDWPHPLRRLCLPSRRPWLCRRWLPMFLATIRQRGENISPSRSISPTLAEAPLVNWT